MIRQVAADGRLETGGAFSPIRRTRVTDRIAAAARQRITLIVAPAGYGKSVALREYLGTLRDEQVCLFSMRADHNSLLGFVRGFSDALTAFAPDARKTASGAYEKNAASKTPGLDLAMWMHAHIKTMSGVIAIDDLQIAEADPEITRFVVSLIERTRGRVRWILSSRSALDLPVGSWLAYGEMDLNIDEHDLAFTIDEARETAKSVRVSVRDEELEKILQMTSGWPTALSFALRTSTRSVDLRNIAANTREMVYRYLAEQVYGSLAQDDRELLQLIAFLPEIDLAVLRFAGYNRAKAQIELLRDRVAFIYPERPGVYRAHDLFADFLRHEVELQGDEALRAVQLRAGSALERAGNAAAALRVYAEMRAEPEILRVLGAHGFTLMDHAHGDAVALAIGTLDTATRSEHPVVLALRAEAAADAGRFDRAQGLYERAIQMSTVRAFAADTGARLGLLLFDQQRYAIELLEEYAFDECLPLETRAVHLSLLAPSYALTGRAQDAADAMERAQGFASILESDEVRAKLYHRMGIASFVLDAPHDQTAAFFSRAQALAGETGLFVTLAAALGGLQAVALIYEDDLTKAAWLAQQGMNAGLKAGNRLAVQAAILQIAHIEMRRGTPQRLAALEKQFATTITSDVQRSAYIVPARSLLAAWEGRFEDAFRMLSGFKYGSPYRFDAIMHLALLALYATGKNDRDSAVLLTARAMEEVQRGGFEGLHGARTAEMVKSLCAIVDSLCGRISSARQILSRKPAANGAGVEALRECARWFARESKAGNLPDVSAEAMGGLHAAGLGGIAALLDRIILVAADRSGDAANPLTPAEIEVLQFLAEGMSPKEIARHSCRSVYTIQAHIQNVIKKLGCSGRSEALTVARRKHLVKFN